MILIAVSYQTEIRLPRNAAALSFVPVESSLHGTKCGMFTTLTDILESITAAAQKN